MAEINAFQAESLQAAPEQNTNTELRDRLISSREQKIARLAPKTGYGELDRQPNTFVDMGDYRESMANKVVNDYSPAELDAIAEDLNRRFGVVVEGNQAFQYDDQGNKVPYEGNVNTLASFYEYGTKDGGFKIGTWGGIDPYERYSDSYLAHQKETIGDRGVNRDDLRRHYILPIEQVDLLEGLYHGNTNFLNNRSLRQGLDQVQGQGLIEYQEARKAFGSGATEVYNTFDRGSVEDTDTKALFKAFNERFFPEPLTNEQIKRNLRDQLKRRDAEEGVGLINRLGNAAAGIAPTVASQLFIEPAMAIAEMMGYSPDTTSEERILAVQEAMGYNNAFADKAAREVSEKVSKIIEDVQSDKDVDVSDVWDMFVSAGSSPELLTTSVAAVVAMSAGFGKFTRMGKAIAEVDKLKKAGRISPQEAKNQIYDIKEAHSLMDNIAHFGANNAGFIASVAGDVNGRVERFMENNEGEHTPNDILRLTAVSTAIMAIDRFSGNFALSGNVKNVIDKESVEAIKGIVDTLPPNQYLDFVRTSGAALKQLSEAAVVEGGAEYVQTLADIVSVQYATSKYGDDIGEIVANQDNQIEALTGAAIGSVMGGQMSAGGSAVRGVGSLVNKTVSPTPAVEEEAELTPEQLAQEQSDRTEYSQTLTRMADLYRVNNSYTPEDLASVLKDHATLERTRYSVQKNSNASKLAQADSVLLLLEKGIADAFKASTDVPNINQFTSIVDGSSVQTEIPVAERSTLADKLVNMVASSEAGNVSPELVTKLKSFAKQNGVTEGRVDRIIKSYASVQNEIEEEVGGITDRDDRLTLLKNSGTATKQQYQKEYDDVKSWYSTTNESIGQLQQGILRAQQRAATENAKMAGANKSGLVKASTKPVIVKTDYKTHKQSNKKGEAFDITVSLVDGKWVAHTATANELIARKQDSAKRLQSLLARYHNEVASELYADTMLTFGGMVIPSAVSTTKKDTKQSSRDREATYVNNAVETIKSLTGNTEASVNKVILGNVRRAKWHPSSQRTRSNSAIINTHGQGVEYSSNDVVYLHAPELFSPANNKKRKVSVLAKTSSLEGKEVQAAIDAGATFVLDQDMLSTPRVLASLREYLTKKGYVALGVKNDQYNNSENIYVKAENIAANGQTYQEIHDARVAEGQERKEASTARTNTLDALVSASLDLEGAKVLGEDTTELQKTYDDAFKESLQYFTKASVEQAVNNSVPVEADQNVYINSNGEAVSVSSVEDAETSIDVSDDSSTIDADVASLDNSKTREEKAQAYVDRVTRATITKLKQDKRASPDKPFASKYKEALVTRAQELDETRASQTVNMLNAWKNAALLRLNGQALVDYVSKALETFGSKLFTRKTENATVNDFILNSQAKDILENSVAGNKELKYYVVSYIGRYPEGKKKTFTRNVFTIENTKVGDKLVGEAAHKALGLSSSKMTSAEVSSIREMNVNPTNLLKVGSPSVLGTAPVSGLPEVFVEVTNKTRKNFNAVIQPLTEPEKNFEFKRDGTDQSGLFNLLDSPARALIFKSDGTVNDNALAAIGVSIRDVLYRDKYKLTVGPKDNRTIAAMFNITEETITDAHRTHANNYGMYAKSVANTLGQSILGSLGLSRNQDGARTLGMYERLVADLGNMALLVAEEEGLLKTVEVPSNELAKLYKDGEEWGTSDDGTEAKTRLVELTTKSKGVPSSAVDGALVEFDQINSFVPDITRSAKEPFYGERPDDKAIERMKTTVRNDLVGAVVPEEAQKAIERFAKTEYKLNLTTTKSFLDAFDKADSKERNGILKQLGYIEIDNNNPDYKVLLADRKLIQESINRDVLNDIERLRTAYSIVTESGKNSMYFGFFYTTNQRYNIDSTTLNPQASKLHRFFVQPAIQEVSLTTGDNGTFTYSMTNKDGEVETIDTSLYVRAALAQAFGVGIDKEYTEDIISVGNVLLGLPADKIAAIRSELYVNGAITVKVDGEDVKFKPDHLSHALSGLDFIEKFNSTKVGENFTTDLTVEFDALTSGFSNKVQQFGRLDNLQDHLSRVGVLGAEEYEAALNRLNDQNRSNDTLGVNDTLADPTSVDSYKNLGKKVIFKIMDKIRGVDKDGNPIVPAEGSKDKVFDTNLQKMFEDMEALLPGSDQRNAQRIDDIVVSKTLRNLFKPGFMIFNYSAGINRIVKNLGQEIAEQTLETISKTDFSKLSKTDPLVIATEALLNGGNGSLYWSENKKQNPINTIEELQTALQTLPLNKIMRKVSFVDAKDSRKKLTDFIANDLVAPTYGSAMKDVFTDEFGAFIEIQDITNDAFKMSFAVFNDLFTTMVKQHNQAGNTTVTETDVLTWIGMLKRAFPAIVGPLSKTLEEGVYVYNVDRRTPNSLLVTAPSPQTRMNTARPGGTKSRVINPLLKSITAAANAGAVLPFHALDGAQMARLSESFSGYLEQYMNLHGGGAVLPIHDAITVPLPFADRAVWYYNRESQRLNNEYSMLSEIYNMSDRITDIVNNGLTLSGQVNPETGETLKIKVNPNTLTLPNTLSKKTKDTIKDSSESESFNDAIFSINNRLREYYDVENQVRSNPARDVGKRYGVMVGLPGSLYETKSNVKDNDYEFDDTYLSTYADRGLYKLPKVSFDQVAVAEEVVDTVTTSADIVAKAEAEPANSSGDVVEDSSPVEVKNGTIAPETFANNANYDVIDDLENEVKTQVGRCKK